MFSWSSNDTWIFVDFIIENTSSVKNLQFIKKWVRKINISLIGKRFKLYLIAGLFPKLLIIFNSLADYRRRTLWEGCSAAWQEHRSSWLRSVRQRHHDGPLHWTGGELLHAGPGKINILLDLMASHDELNQSWFGCVVLCVCWVGFL